MFKSPMLAETVEKAADYRYPAYVSEKLDGVRCVIIDGVLYSRTNHAFKPNVQERFAPIAQAAKECSLILDGELYFENDDFGSLMSVLSSDIATLEAKKLRFYCFDAIAKDEWESDSPATPFVLRYGRYIRVAGEWDPEQKLMVPVKQTLCTAPEDTQMLFDEVTSRNGEGVMIRDPEAPYRFDRSKAIVKLKHWLSAEATVVAIHQQACPVKYAEEIKEENGKQQGYKLTAGSVTVKILPGQPLPADALQNATFCGCEGVDSVALRKHFWESREQLIGKTVEFQYLKGGQVGRMARIMRLRPDKDGLA